MSIATTQMDHYDSFIDKMNEGDKTDERVTPRTDELKKT